MPVYLGSLGRMIKLPYVTSQSVEAEERYSFDRTLEGRRKAQVKPVGRRTWALATQHFRPEEHSLLSAFANGAWGPGPFVFVSADAPHTNLLTPATADCIEVQPTPGSVLASNPEYAVNVGGPVDLGADGWASRSWSVHPNYGVINFMVGLAPVLPGVPATASAWVKGAGASVRIYWYDANGSFMQVTPAGNEGSLSAYNRISVTGTPPAGAVGMRVGVTSASSATRPALTWTSSVQSWADGQGCEKAVVSAFSRDQVLAVVGNTFSNVSFTVTEVG